MLNVFRPRANGIFDTMSRRTIDNLAAMGFKVTEGELDETAPPRFVTAWNTTSDEVDALLAAAAAAVE